MNRIKKDLLKYIKANNNFSIIIPKRSRPIKSFSVESFNASYLIPKNKQKNHGIRSTNLTSENLKKQRNDNESNKSQDNNIINDQLIISSNNNSNATEANNNALNVNNIRSRNEKNNKDRSIDSYSSERKSKKYKYEIKEYNTNAVNNEKNNIILSNTSKMSQESMPKKEEDEIDFNLIITKFNEKNNDIQKIHSKDNLLKNDSLQIPLVYDSYYSIFKYLNNDEILKLSLLNKLNWVCVMYYWMNY